jgi:ketosteroid isomerase-like protein
MKEQIAFLEKFNEAFAKADINYIIEQVSDDIVWDMVGDFLIKGKEAFNHSLKEMEGVETLDMQIQNTIIEGRNAAVNGSMKVKESSGTIREFGFCDVYEFNKEITKIQKMTSYVLPIKSE